MSEKKTERYSLISVYSRSSKSTISMLRVKEIKILFFLLENFTLNDQITI